MHVYVGMCISGSQVSVIQVFFVDQTPSSRVQGLLDGQAFDAKSH